MPVAAALLLLLGPSCIPPVPVVAHPGPVVVPFVAPACPRCAGHRGVTMSVRAGSTVRFLTVGTVVFDGTVARRRFVVVRTPVSDLVTYGDLAGEPHTKGTKVAVGDPAGVSRGLVYVGVRRAGVPVDPRTVIGSPAARLVPPRSLACPVGPARARR